MCAKFGALGQSVTISLFFGHKPPHYTEDKASDVRFCSAVHRRPRQGITNFGELCSPKSPKSDESASARATPTRILTLP